MKHRITITTIDALVIIKALRNDLGNETDNRLAENLIDNITEKVAKDLNGGQYDCSCFVDYPNESHRKINGSWKCVDKYEKCEDWKSKSIYGCKTHCRRKE